MGRRHPSLPCWMAPPACHLPRHRYQPASQMKSEHSSWQLLTLCHASSPNKPYPRFLLISQMSSTSGQAFNIVWLHMLQIMLSCFAHVLLVDVALHHVRILLACCHVVQHIAACSTTIVASVSGVSSCSVWWQCICCHLMGVCASSPHVYRLRHMLGVYRITRQWVRVT